MTLTATGFDGSIFEADLARMAPHFGPPVVEGPGHFAVSIVAGLDRTVSVAAGAADACFVRVVNDAPTNKQSPTLSSGTRWDTVVLRRDWTDDVATLEVVPGTSTRAVAAGVLDDPGTEHDQLLGLFQITSGIQAPTDRVDLRRWGPGGRYARSLLAAGPNPPVGTELVVDGLRYMRVLDAGGSVVWSTLDAPEEGSLSLGSVWSAAPAELGYGQPRWRRDRSGLVRLSGLAQYTGASTPVTRAQLGAQSLGNLPERARPAAKELLTAWWNPPGGLLRPLQFQPEPSGPMTFGPADAESVTLPQGALVSLAGISYQGA